MRKPVSRFLHTEIFSSLPENIEYFVIYKKCKINHRLYDLIVQIEQNSRS